MIPVGLILKLGCSGASPKVILIKKTSGPYLEKYHYHRHYRCALEIAYHKSGIKEYTNYLSNVNGPSSRAKVEGRS